ncbi:hypothetical protein K438DRAFT_2011397 [Mycena galopus ATCC 62051]|nr:hypothetical protein K438DRAFT_2011397 [Mycena galopus ATCC 62051]
MLRNRTKPGQEPVEAVNHTDLSLILAQQIMQTIWNKLPLQWRKAMFWVIAQNQNRTEAHKKKADDLVAQGSPDGSSNRAVYREYCNYLKLCPDTESAEYKNMQRKVYLLEQAATANGDTDLALDHHNHACKSSDLVFWGIPIVAIVVLVAGASVGR